MKKILIVMFIDENGDEDQLAYKDFPPLLDHVPQIGSSLIIETLGELQDLVRANVNDIEYDFFNKEIRITCVLCSADDIPAFTEEKGWNICG